MTGWHAQPYLLVDRGKLGVYHLKGGERLSGTRIRKIREVLKFW